MVQGPLLPAPLVVTGHLVTFDEARPEIADGALYVDTDGLIVAVRCRVRSAAAGVRRAREPGGHGRGRLPGAHRPAQPHRLQLPAAVDRAGPVGAVDRARPVAEGPRLPAVDLAAGQRAVQGQRQGGAEVRRDEGGRRRRDGDPGLVEGGAAVRGLDGAQHRVRDVSHRAGGRAPGGVRAGGSRRSSRGRRRRWMRARRSSTTSPRGPTRRWWPSTTS